MSLQTNPYRDPAVIYEEPFAPSTFLDAHGHVVQRLFVTHSHDPDKKVELFWMTPAGTGPWPVCLFIHGHQWDPPNGGEAPILEGRLQQLVARGFVAVALSQPGYGNSDGPPDFCGPFSQRATLDALHILRNQPFAQSAKILLYGQSRGALVSSMVATQDPMLLGVILNAGNYDFFATYPTPIAGINENIEREMEISDEAFLARSAIYHAEKIQAPVLLIHGRNDDRLSVAQAEAFGRKLQEHGLPAKVVIVEDVEHRIPLERQFQEIDRFLAEYGIGA